MRPGEGNRTEESALSPAGSLCLLKVRVIVNFQQMSAMSLSKPHCDFVALQILKKYRGLRVNP